MKLLARWFHALGDSKRLQIIERLMDGEQCVCDLSEALDLGQSLLSFHLRTLKDAGVVKDRRDGRWMYYSLNPSVFGELAAFFTERSEQAHLSIQLVPCP